MSLLYSELRNFWFEIEKLTENYSHFLLHFIHCFLVPSWNEFCIGWSLWNILFTECKICNGFHWNKDWSVKLPCWVVMICTNSLKELKNLVEMFLITIIPNIKSTSKMQIHFYSVIIQEFNLRYLLFLQLTFLKILFAYTASKINSLISSIQSKSLKVGSPCLRTHQSSNEHSASCKILWHKIKKRFS